MHFIAVRNANVFDLISRTILEPVELRTNMRKLLTHIVSLKIVSATLAETPFSQYLDLLIALTQHVSEKSKSLDCDDTRLNHSFFNESSHSRCQQNYNLSSNRFWFWVTERQVYREVNVNQTVLKVNMNEKSIVSHKLLIDHMQKNSLLPSAIKIISKFKRSVKTAHQRCELNFEQQTECQAR